MSRMPHGVFASMTTTNSRNSIQLVLAGCRASRSPIRVKTPGAILCTDRIWPCSVCTYAAMSHKRIANGGRRRLILLSDTIIICPLVRWSAGPLVRWSAGPLVAPLAFEGIGDEREYFLRHGIV